MKSYKRVSAALAGLGAILALGLSSCDTFWWVDKVPLYCDTSADCTYASAPDAVFCNLDPAVGVTHKCIAAASCEPTMSGQDCPDETPICDMAQEVCLPCELGASGDQTCASRADDTPRCADHGGCVACLPTQGDCAGDAPICGADYQCQACTDDAQCMDEYPDEPRHTCAPNGRCVECRDHGDCASQVCDSLLDTCVAPEAVVYVDGDTGMDGAECGTQDMPCRTIGSGLARVTEGREIVKIVEGTQDYQESIFVPQDMTVRFLGPATISPSSQMNGPALQISSGSDVSLEHMTLSRASGTNEGDGVRCVEAKLSLFASTVSSNAAIGVKVSSCELTIERSLIDSNRSGGLSITDSNFTVRNNMITHNGTAGASGSGFGGVNINNINIDKSPQILDFNTIADSLASDTAVAAGIACLARSPVTASNNIVFEKDGGMYLVLSSNCNWTYSNIEQDPLPLGAGNVNTPPTFADPANGDFHLSADSTCCIDAADPGATVDIDFDGDPRPQGERRDIGADEYVAP